MAIFSDWFLTHFIPAVCKHQEDVLKLPADEVKALLILDNAPAHPSGNQLEEEDDLMTRGERTAANINYNLKSVIFTVAAAWKTVKTNTLANAWKKLLYDDEIEYDFEGFEAKDFHRILHRSSQTDVTEDDVQTWFEDTEGDPGYQMMTEEITDDVIAGGSRDDSDDDDGGDETLPMKPKLSVVRESLYNFVNYIHLSTESEIQQYYQHFRAFKEIIIRKQQQPQKQLEIN
ncbi:tigger transposable element-derived protein 7-like [Macrobrachium rosenbergii]|uniref:tigger transposable element-derived protein 7-like n=1 Tax=Macrobrachium rosenbergii TaxID=79674 RepID=UPI0034D3C19A